MKRLLLVLSLLVFSLTSIAQRQPAIVGGAESTPHVYPWMAALVGTGGGTFADRQFCGGTLVHPYWVVTATHCLTGQSDNYPDTFEIVFGGHNLATDTPATVTVAQVAEIFLHPAYETAVNPSIDGDIALVRLKNPATNFTALPLVHDTSFTTPGTTSRVMGWGLTTDGGQASTFLREVDLPLVSLATADATGAYGSPLKQDMLPAGFAAGGKDSCQGDSGGPLMIRHPRNNRWMLAGVVSFGAAAGCAATNAYGIYARVTYYHEWLMKTMHPAFGRWANTRSVVGVFDNTDGDRFSSIAEFAFNTQPGSSNNTARPRLEKVNVSNQDYPAVRFRRLRNNTDLDYRVFQSSNLSNWTRITDLQANTVSSSNLDADTEELVIRSGQSATQAGIQFMNVQIEPSKGFNPVGFTPGGTLRMRGTLDNSLPTDPTRTGGTYYIRDFSLGGYTNGQPIEFQFISRSNVFSPHLSLIAEANGQVIASTSTNGAELRWTFTPQAGTNYRVRLSSVESAGSGIYSFNFPPVAAGGGGGGPQFPEIAVGGSVDGELTDSDGVGDGFFFDDYRLTGATVGQQVTVTVTSNPASGGFNPTVTVFDEGDNQVASGGNSQAVTTANATFTPLAGKTYTISVINFTNGAKGTYQLSVAPAS
ncbi:MAG: hypothetical protein CMO80_03775 [Verrucomicrobiales bacterium]|nr:hypothetical protein [Verrucomicrobiales bacterium]